MSSALILTQDGRTAPLGTLVWGHKASNGSDQKARASLQRPNPHWVGPWELPQLPYAVPRYTHLQPANLDRGVQGDSRWRSPRVPPKQGFDVGIIHNDNTSYCFAQFIGEHLINKTLWPLNPITEVRGCAARAIKVLQAFLPHRARPEPEHNICPRWQRTQIRSWPTCVHLAADVDGPGDVLHRRGHTRIPDNCRYYNLRVRKA